MRACFKHDLYYLATKREAEKQAKQQAQQKQLKQAQRKANRLKRLKMYRELQQAKKNQNKATPQKQQIKTAEKQVKDLKNNPTENENPSQNNIEQFSIKQDKNQESARKIYKKVNTYKKNKSKSENFLRKDHKANEKLQIELLWKNKQVQQQRLEVMDLVQKHLQDMERQKKLIQQQNEQQKTENINIEQQQPQQQSSKAIKPRKSFMFNPISTLNLNKFQSKTLNKDELKKQFKEQKLLRKQAKQIAKKEEQFQKKKQKQQKASKEQKNAESQSQSQIQEENRNRKPKKQKETKKKKITKGGQYLVRLNLKRRYTQRFKGPLSQRYKYFSNGVLKPQYRSKLKTSNQFTVEDGQIYNSYINSLSKALYFNVSLQSDSENQESQSQKPIHYTIPEQKNKQNMQQLLKAVFGFEKFRQGQWEVIQNIFNNKSTLFVSETASGKSLTYIFASFVLQGLSIVVSPLISLMLDQLQHLPPTFPAACISSLLSYPQKIRIINMVKQKQIKLLFITPQSLQSDFSYHLRQFPPVNFVCIDEAHCLSEFSHNFRPSYLLLQEMVNKYFVYKHKDPVVLCLTATANIGTMQSIENKFNISNTIKNKSILNPNLYITVSRESGMQKLQGLVNYLNYPIIKKHCRTMLIYCRTKKLLFQVYNYLKNSGFRIAPFHGALAQKQKVDLIQNFRTGKIRIVVSTNALGMGLDFANLDGVIHMNMPKCVQSYIQEIGRAGRRNRRAYCHLFLDPDDYFTERNYILSDNLQIYDFKQILQVIQNNTDYKPKQKKQIYKASVKRLIQEIAQENNNYIEQQEIFEENNEEDVQQMQPLPTADTFLPLSYVKLTTIQEKTKFKQESLIPIFLKIQKQTEGMFKFHPLSYQTVKISFFKQNKDELCQKSQFFSSFIKDSKVIRGSIYVPLLLRCNEMKKMPLQILGNIYQLAHQYMLKIQLLNQSLIWQMKLVKQNRIEQLSSFLKKKFSQKDSKNKWGIVDELNQVQSGAMMKLNAFYSISFIHSILKMRQLLQSKKIVRPDENIPKQNILDDISQYFASKITEFYNNLTILQDEDGQQNNQNEVKISKQIKISYLPTTKIRPQDQRRIYESVKAFFKHEYNNKGDFSNMFQTYQTQMRQISKPYLDGKLITRIFLGVNDSKINWKVYGQHPYWMLFKDKQYVELLQAVKSAIRQYLKDERIYIF